MALSVASYAADQILVPPNRQRLSFDMAKIMELANSIQLLGLLQPIILTATGTLVAGERRLRACKHLTAMGIQISCGGTQYLLGTVPAITLDYGDPLLNIEAELHENIKREDLTWQERAAAEAMLHELRLAQNPKQTLTQTTAELSYDDPARLNNSITVSALLGDKEISTAASLKDAVKVLKKREEKARLTRLSESVNVKTLSSAHELHNLDWRAGCITPGSLDVILTDPPYGMGAHTFKDGGDASTVPHEYDDMGSEAWESMMREFADWSFSSTKPKAHLYVFCDVDKFHFLRGILANIGWRVHRTPLVYAKSHAASRRVPWPTMGPRRSYELVLYAVKGDRNVNTIASDVFSSTSNEENLGHAAQKPVSVYVDLLKRSVAPGNLVCDPFCGTGTIFPAAQEVKCRAIGFEKDPAFHGIAIERLEKLK